MVTGVRTWTGLHDMRNLTVDLLHTYYVIAGNTPVLVHNCGAEGIGDPTAKGGVYALVTKSGKVVRTGMAKNLIKRAAQHAKAFPELEFKTLYRSDSRAVRRGLEQMASDAYRPILNRINPISLLNPRRGSYIAAANNFFRLL